MAAETLQVFQNGTRAVVRYMGRRSCESSGKGRLFCLLCLLTDPSSAGSVLFCVLASPSRSLTQRKTSSINYLPLRDESQGLTLQRGAAGTADAVNVILVRRGQVVVDDV